MDQDKKAGTWDNLRKLLDDQMHTIMRTTAELRMTPLGSGGLSPDDQLFAELLYRGTTPMEGRFVTYHLVPRTGTAGNDTAPAIITKVWSPTCVNLTVFPDFTSSFRVHSVTMHEGPEVSLGFEWSWPERPA